jgi:hypothetical protein
MDWKPASELPTPGVKLWGWSASRGGPVVVMLVKGMDRVLNGSDYRFIDANSIPVNDVEAWAYAVAPGETA